MILFIVLQYNKLNAFFNAYVSSPSAGNQAGGIITALFVLAILVVVTFALLMFLLMKNKKKPTTLYLLTLAYYVLMLIAVIYAASLLSTLERTQLTQQAARAYRDIFLMISFPQYIFLILSAIRGVGFDVKKFNFGKDLQELEIDAKDNEEFEFVLGTDTYIYERKLRRTLREMKYYVLENKLILGGIFVAIAGVLLINWRILYIPAVKNFIDISGGIIYFRAFIVYMIFVVIKYIIDFIIKKSNKSGADKNVI